MGGRDRQSSQDGFTTSTSAVSSDDMGVVAAFGIPATARRGVLSNHCRESKCTLIVRTVKRITLRIHTWRLLIGDEIFNT